jgi:hypothetical protein
LRGFTFIMWKAVGHVRLAEDLDCGFSWLAMQENKNSRVERWREQTRKYGLTILLVLEIVTLFVLIPLLGLQMFRPKSEEVVLIPFILAVAIAAIAQGRRSLILIAFAVFMGIAANLFLRERVSDASTIVFLVVALTFLLTLTAIVGAIVYGPGHVTAHRIQGAIVIYLHFALIFAYLYAIVLFFWPDAFGDKIVATNPFVGREFLYFSFTTLTTVGYGDIVPVHPIARSLANLEAIIGQLYPATLLARLVTLPVAARGQ